MDLIGKQFGDYQLERKFASGGMAHIYLGRDEKLGRISAIKILTPDILAQDSSLAERFSREARAIARLEHDNIIPIYQYGYQDDHYFLAMRYVERGDLAQAMLSYQQAGQLMPVQRALFILTQVASALDHAHKRQIIHRDVKPSNILLGDDDKAFLSDFGLVLWQDVDKTLGTAFGTPRYIAPEQASDSEQSAPASDIYSLAVIVYEILTGQILFQGNTPMEVALAHITQEPIPPREHNSAIPLRAQNEILKALSKEPAERHVTALQFIEALRDAYLNQDEDVSDKTQILLPDEHSQTPVRIARPQTPSIPASPDSPTVKEERTPLPSSSRRASTRRLWLMVVPLFILLGVASLALLNAQTEQAPLPTLASSLLVTETTTPTQAIAVADTDDSPTSTATDMPSATETSPPTDTPPTNTPSPPPPTLTPTVTPTQVMTFAIDDQLDLIFIYNPNIFAIYNPNPTRVSLESLRFATVRDVAGDAFESSAQNLGTFLEAGTCVVLLGGTARRGDVPPAWNCSPERGVNLSSQNLFWFADASDDDAFTVTRNNILLATCPTVGRAVGRLSDMRCPEL